MIHGRRGFTLVEILVVSVFLGVLSGIAVPSLARAIDRAAAARVVSDARNISLAVRQYLEGGVQLPPSGEWGAAPAGFEEFLPEGMAFTFRDTEYRLMTQPIIDRAELWVRYPEGSPLDIALKAHRNGTTVTWTPTRTTFFLVGLTS